MFDGLSAKAVVNSQKNLMMKIELCCAATKKSPERFNARGFVSCGLKLGFLRLGGGFGVGDAGATQLGLVILPFTYTLDGLQRDPTSGRRA